MIASKERRNFIEKDSSRAGGDGLACACAVRTSYPGGGGATTPISQLDYKSLHFSSTTLIMDGFAAPPALYSDNV